MQDLSSQPQSVEAVVPNQQQQVTQTPSGDTMTRAALNSFFDSLLKKQKVCLSTPLVTLRTSVMCTYLGVANHMQGG